MGGKSYARRETWFKQVEAGETAGQGMETLCLNIILLEVTMRALVCPSPLDLITNSANRAISSPQHLSDDRRWIEGRRRVGVTLIVKLTADYS